MATTSKKAKATPFKAGSRKQKVRAVYDAKGAEHAWVLGQKLKLKQGTLRTWLGAWAREA